MCLPAYTLAEAVKTHQNLIFQTEEKSTDYSVYSGGLDISQAPTDINVKYLFHSLSGLVKGRFLSNFLIESGKYASLGLLS